MESQINLPFVSIIIAVYNGAGTIGAAIESLLEQSYPKDRYEMIVVDNNSTDDTARIVQSFNVKYLMEKNIQGPAAARNTGSKDARGEILAFLDADQIAHVNWLKNLIQGWENPEYGAFGGGYQYLPSQDIIALKMQIQELKAMHTASEPNQKIYAYLAGGNAAYRRDVFKKLKGFDATMFSSEDYDLALRMQKQFNLKIKYNFEAIVYNHPRDWKPLVRREYRIGFGHAMLGIKHNEAKNNFGAKLLNVFKRTMLGLGVIVLSLFKRIRWQSKEEKIKTIFLDISMQWANCLGQVHYFLKWNQRRFPAHW